MEVGVSQMNAENKELYWEGYKAKESPVIGMNVVLMVRNIPITPGSALDKLLEYQFWSHSFLRRRKKLVYVLKELRLMPVPKLTEAQGKRTLLFL